MSERFMGEIPKLGAGLKASFWPTKKSFKQMKPHYDFFVKEGGTTSWWRHRFHNVSSGISFLIPRTFQFTLSWLLHVYLYVRGRMIAQQDGHKFLSLLARLWYLGFAQYILNGHKCLSSKVSFLFPRMFQFTFSWLLHVSCVCARLKDCSARWT